jgi:hypothetical protein
MLGFSQGANMATIYAAHIEAGPLPKANRGVIRTDAGIRIDAGDSPCAGAGGDAGGGGGDAAGGAGGAGAGGAGAGLKFIVARSGSESGWHAQLSPADGSGPFPPFAVAGAVSTGGGGANAGGDSTVSTRTIRTNTRLSVPSLHMVGEKDQYKPVRATYA